MTRDHFNKQFFDMMKLKNLFIVCAMVASCLTSPTWAHSEGNYVHSDFFETMKTGDKAALLMVHFGTTHDDTRALTIEVINEKARNLFPTLEFREAYTSRIVMNRLAKRGIDKKNPIEALAQLKADGYTHVLIQSTNIIDGIEMESLRKDINQMKDLFKEIRLGAPLLYAPEDYEQVIEILTKKGGKKGEMTLLVGHGTYTPATAQYAMLDYMLQAEGHTDFAVTTVEGYPALDDAINRIEGRKGVKKIQLLPFMFVAGDHAKNDIAGDIKTELESQGYQVSVLLEGLGQNPGIQDIFIEHAKFMTQHKLIDISDKKKAYAADKE